eukprot:CAMPEP_0168565142 /NCGR_PEP_ID=MMETSP0413-20121227/13656_1 /TAXON_ID=136452 /ORGANISM="Filamoeba nolandi, Strain NC-AS-23-1" /LENGTH=400 /DNA_ID=CAMNT_0008596931 /DNA_START=26 /DNA_END=1228 /DNA_ORIENTATION=+
MKHAVWALVLLGCFSIVLSLDNGLALLPPMGWSTWCTKSIECLDDWCSEREIHEIAEAMVKNGMKDLGYNYINLDDCWAGDRDANGELTADPRRFPSGMKALADYVHSLGLKLGLYTCAGNLTCKGGRPGSWGHFDQDAQTFANWEVDQVKMDWCHHPSNPPSEVYAMFRDSLNKTGRPIFFSICEWGQQEPWTWGMETGNAWRIGHDHLPFWRIPGTDQGVYDIIEQMAGKSPYAGPGGWNDPDFLMTGEATMTHLDSVTEFSFWSLWAAPLIVATDIRVMLNKDDILLNAEVIAVNQDKLAIPGDRIANYSNGAQIWSKPLSDGSYAVILYNSGKVGHVDITVMWSALWGKSGVVCSVRDLWKHEDLGDFVSQFSASVEAHGVVMIKATPQEEMIIKY